jgi:predicted N-acyltransferase
MTQATAAQAADAQQGSATTTPAGNGNGGATPTTVQASLQVAQDLAHIDAAAWDALVDAAPHPTPFMRHAYLAALQSSGSAVADTGWQPLYLLLHALASADDRGRAELCGACVLYLKSHSYGEYVFDWAWADAWQRAGRDYYPKLLSAVPFTPVPGSRLLARDAETRQALLQGMSTLAREQGWSSAHLLFMDEADQAAARQAGWLLRQGVQFHWSNRGATNGTVQGVTNDAGPAPYRDWDDYLASLTRDKRKKLTQERGYVARAGVTFEVRRGSDISTDDWDHFYRCYCSTYREHHSTPYLSRAFFDSTRAALPELWLMFIARREGERVAASLVALDDTTRTAWGRYWGATERINHLHFAACYHEPLRWCVEHGWQRFEGGAQGEHKLARGLMPVATWSAHWLADREFSSAVARFLERERSGVASYLDELQAHSPFRA